MNTVHIAWRNIGRNKRRSLLSVLAVAFAVAALLFSMALQQGGYADMIYNAVHANTGHLQIQQAGYLKQRELTQHLTRLGELVSVLDHQPDTPPFAPRIQATALVSREQRTFGALIVGVDPVREPSVSRLAKVVVEGEFLQPGDADGAVVGQTLARNLNAGVGDEIVFLGQGADGSLAASRLVIRGLFRFGNQDMDRSALAIGLPLMQETFAMPDAATEIAFLLPDDRFREQTTHKLEALLAAHGFDHAVVRGWPELLPGIEQNIKVDWSSGLIMYSIMALVVGFGIANTFLMAFMERMYEMGIMLSLGMRPYQLSTLLYMESTLLTLLGVVGGVLLGTPIVQYFNMRGVSFGEQGANLLQEFGLSPKMYPQLTPMVYGWAIGIVAGISLVVAIYPAIRAARLQPVEALRSA